MYVCPPWRQIIAWWREKIHHTHNNQGCWMKCSHIKDVLHPRIHVYSDGNPDHEKGKMSNMKSSFSCYLSPWHKRRSWRGKAPKNLQRFS